MKRAAAGWLRSVLAAVDHDLRAGARQEVAVQLDSLLAQFAHIAVDESNSPLFLAACDALRLLQKHLEAKTP